MFENDAQFDHILANSFWFRVISSTRELFFRARAEPGPRPVENFRASSLKKPVKSRSGRAGPTGRAGPAPPLINSDMCDNQIAPGGEQIIMVDND